MAEQFGGDLIDALVGTLGTQNDGHKQLKHAAELQFRIHVGHLLAEMRQNPLVSLFFSHCVQRYEKIE